MPGINLRCRKIGNDEFDSSSMNSLIHDDRYKAEIVFKNDFYLIACTKYDEYPVQIFDNKRLLICLEGRIYDQEPSSLNKAVQDLVTDIFDNGITDNTIGWISERDGDFIIYALNKQSDECIIMNDALGRLPVYYYEDQREFIVSREIQFILNLIKKPSLDRMAIAQSLIFNYPLGERTLVENVHRLEPATVLGFNGGTRASKVEKLYAFNFEKKNKEPSLANTVDKLASLFSLACKRRSGLGSHNLLSLSGGRDSRAVAVGLQQNKIPFLALTFLDPDKKYQLDLEIAEKLSTQLNLQWESHLLSHPTGGDLDKLIKMKFGLNYLAMAFIVQFLEDVIQKHGSGFACFSGDGGDKVLPNLNPQRNFKHIGQLVSYIISANGIFRISEAAALTGISKEEITEEITKEVSSFPENDLNQKYVHFIIYERAIKWLFEGEDRNRFFFWTVAPFYSVPFFRYAMACQDSIKSYDRLFDEFMSRLSPLASDPDYVGHFRSKHSTLRKYFFEVKKNLKIRVRGSLLFPLAIRLMGLSYNEKSVTIRCLRDQIDGCKFVSSYLSAYQLARIIANCMYYPRIGLDNLFTVTCVIEKLYCNSHTLLKYQKDYFT